MILFDEEQHKYDLDGKELLSVSKWIDRFVPPFNSEYIAKAVAKKKGITDTEVLAQWEMKKNIALHRGNWVHESIEYYLKHDQDFENEPTRAFKEVMSDNKYHSEVIVHSDKLAGTVDLIESVGDGKVKIHDFKTNADLYKKHGKLLYPFDDLENCPFNKYRLQLSKYKELLEKMKDVEVVELNIWWYNEGKFEIINVEEINLTRDK